MITSATGGVNGNTQTDPASVSTPAVDQETRSTFAPRSTPSFSMEEAMKRMAQRRNGTGDDTPTTSVPAAAQVPDPKDEDKGDDDDDLTGLLGDEDDDEKPAPSDGTRPPASTDDDDPILFELDGAPVRKSEAIKGYQRHQTFTKRTQELAEIRRSLETEAEGYRTRRGQFEGVLRAQFEAAQQNAPRPPDPSLQQTDPIAYSDQAAAYLLWRDQQAERADKLRKIDEERTAENERLRAAKIREESAKMLEIVPSLKKAKDDKQRSALMKAFRSTAEAAGYSADELKSLMDHRAILLLEWATRGRLRAMKRTTSKTATDGQKPTTTVVGATLKGGNGGSPSRAPTASPSVVAAEQKFKRAPTIEHALELRKARRQTAA